MSFIKKSFRYLPTRPSGARDVKKGTKGNLAMLLWFWWFTFFVWCFDVGRLSRPWSILQMHISPPHPRPAHSKAPLGARWQFLHLTLCGKRRLLIPVRPTGLYERSGGRLQDGLFTIEAVAAKVAVPRAQALQTPAAFSPTLESTEFVGFCSLSPPLICRGLHPSLARRGPWSFSSRTTEEDISFISPSLSFSVSPLLFCAIMFNASLVLCSAQNQVVTSCNREREWLRTKSEIPLPASFHATVFDFPYMAATHLLRKVETRKCI